MSSGPTPSTDDAPPATPTGLRVEAALTPFMASLVDQTSQAFIAIDFDGRVLRSNRAFESLVGYSSDELRALNFRDLTPSPWVSVSEAALARLRATGEAQRYEKEYRHKDGRAIPVELVTDFVRDVSGEPCGYYAFITDIGERKAAEEALRISEERYRRLYDEAPVGYHEIDIEGRIVNINRTECEMLGYTREEMLGRPIFDFMVESHRGDAREAVRRRFEEGPAVMSVERQYRTKDGRVLTVQVENSRIRDQSGQVVGLRSTIQDITDRKQMEAALIASERRARALFEGIEDAVFVHDMRGRILDANPAACRRLGYTREEFLRLTTSDIDDPDFAEGYEDRLRAQLRQGHLRCEGRHRTKSGGVIPVDINTSTIHLEDQTAVLAVIRDITDRKALEETRRQFAEAQLQNAWAIEAKNRALVQSEARYRELTEASLDAVIAADQGGCITLFNPAAERVFGYPAKEVFGHPLTILMPESFRPAHEQGFARYLRTREPRVVGRTVELRGRRKDGVEFPLELSLNAIETDGGVQFIGSIRDQTERHQMRAMLMQSEKLASIGLLSAGVAHEINNPLAFIANNLAVLERDFRGVLAMMAAYESAHDRLAEAAPEVIESVQAISDDLDWPYVRDNLARMLTRTRDGVQRVANIVQTLRGLARTAPPEKEPALLADLFAGALDIVQGRLRRARVELVTDLAPLPKISCVPSQIGQVLINLLVNAIQAIEETGREEGNILHVSIRRHDGEQMIEVADTGVGIPSEALPRLFDPFFTTKPVGEGTGLGLSISHGIITGHGGRIEVQNRPGGGSVFRVFLPEAESGP